MGKNKIYSSFEKPVKRLKDAVNLAYCKYYKKFLKFFKIISILLVS